MKLFIIIIICLFHFSAFGIDYTLEIQCQDLNQIFQRVNVHTMNIANAKTTRSAKGGYYKRKLLKNCRQGLCDVYTDEAPPLLVYEPEHPDAKDNGYVEYPSFSVNEEMVFLIRAQRAYELVMAARPFELKDLLIGDKLEGCFKRYKYLKETFDTRAYLGR